MNYTIGTRVFEDWIIAKEIGAGSYGVVYEIEKNSFGVSAKSALKVIRIPASKVDIKTALSEGMDEDSVVHYFEGCMHEIVKEIAVMSDLKNHPNIVTYEDHHVEKNQDEFGWNILIRMELLTSLQDYQLSHKMTEEEIVRMAKDICNALVYCQERKIIHRDIKPENIFVNELGQFKLGDFGVARTVDKTMSGLSKKGTEGYMAPEVYLGKSYGASVDIYSLGLMMYRLLNGNRMPFLPQAPKPITFQDRESSLVRRMQGEALPEPLYGSEEIKRVILKACAYRPEDRYWAAQEMFDALNGDCKNVSTDRVELSIIENQDEESESVEEKGTVGIWGETLGLEKEDANKKQVGDKEEKFERKVSPWSDLKKFKTEVEEQNSEFEANFDKKIEDKLKELEESKNKRNYKGVRFVIASIVAMILIVIGINEGTKVSQQRQENSVNNKVEVQDEKTSQEINENRDEIKNVEQEKEILENIWRDKKIYIDYVEYELNVSTLQSFLDNGWHKIDEEVFSYDINYANYVLGKDEKEIYVSISDEYTSGELTLKGITVGTNLFRNYQEGVQQIKMTAFGFSEDLILNDLSKDRIIEDMGGLEPYGNILENTQDGIIVEYSDDERDLLLSAWYYGDELFRLTYQHYGY